jgi:hypothetical protein
MLPLLTDLQMSLDPARLFRRALGVAPDPWQVNVLRSPSSQILLNCSRQSGKSTVTAALALHTALYQAPALILAVTPTLRQSQEVFRKIVDGYRAVAPDVPPVAESALRLELSNGSRIVALPGDETTIRSYSAVALLIVDEASRVPDEVYFAVRPMLAVSQGRIAVLSTPFGRRGFFYEAWTAGGKAWHRESVLATDIPRIPASFLEEERAALGFFYPQEYENVFLDTASQLFSSIDIDAAVRPDIAPLWG